jgi:ATP-binding cassette subfamily B protein
MDPGLGRRWLTCKRFVEELYLHEQAVPAADWRDYAARDQFLATLRRRMQDLGISRSVTKRLIDLALSDPGWHSIAALDAAVRMTNSLVGSGGLRAGGQAARVVERFVERHETIAPTYWSVRARPALRACCCAGAWGMPLAGKWLPPADQRQRRFPPNW